MENPTVKLTLDRETLSGLANFLNAATNEVIFVIGKNGIDINFQVMGGLNAATINIPRKAIKELAGEMRMSLDTGQLNTAVSAFDGKEIILAVEAGARLYLFDGKQENYIDLLGEESKAAFTGVRPLPAKFTINADELLKAARGLDKMKVTVLRIAFDGSNKQFQIIGERTTSGFKRLLTVKDGKGEAGKAAFQTKFISDMLAGASGEIGVEIGNNMPIKFIFKLGNADIQSFISPWIDGE